MRYRLMLIDNKEKLIRVLFTKEFQYGDTEALPYSKGWVTVHQDINPKHTGVPHLFKLGSSDAWYLVTESGFNLETTYAWAQLEPEDEAFTFLTEGMIHESEARADKVEQENAELNETISELERKIQSMEETISNASMAVSGVASDLEHMEMPQELDVQDLMSQVEETVRAWLANAGREDLPDLDDAMTNLRDVERQLDNAGR